MSVAESWKTVRLGEVCRVIPGFAFKSKDWCEYGIPVVKIKNIQSDGTVDVHQVDHVPEELFTGKLQKYTLCDGDILIAMTGATAGKTGRLRTEQPMLLNQRVAKVQPTGADPRFIWAVLSSDEYQRRLFHLADGAAQPNMSGGQIENVEISLPPPEIQGRIGHIASAFDDLIANNTRRVAVLEQVAQAVYREWFVNLRFPGYEDARFVNSGPHRHPVGWRMASMLENPYFEIVSENVEPFDGEKTYLATADVDGLEIVGAGETVSFAERPSRAQKQPVQNSVWFARMRDTYKVLGFSNRRRNLADALVLSSGFAGFRARDASSFPFLFLTIDSAEFHRTKDLYCTGATQQALTNSGMGAIELVAPTPAIVKRFGKFVGPILDRIFLLQAQTRVLRQMRDLIIPKLIFGEVDFETVGNASVGAAA